jgi:UPF0271 protein
MAARDRALAEPIARAVSAVDRTLLLFAPAGSALASAGAAHGLTVIAEVFADRNYLGDGSLVPRKRPDALLSDPEAAAVRVIRMLREGKVQSVDGQDVSITAETVCVHGDTPDAVNFARALREKLEEQGVQIRAPGKAA